MQIKIKMRCYNIPTKVTKKYNSTKCWWGYGKMRTLTHYEFSNLEKLLKKSLIAEHTHRFWSNNSTPRGVHVYMYVCIYMCMYVYICVDIDMHTWEIYILLDIYLLIVVLFVIASKWKQLKCFSIDKYIMVYLEYGILFSNKDDSTIAVYNISKEARYKKLHTIWFHL